MAYTIGKQKPGNFFPKCLIVGSAQAQLAGWYLTDVASYSYFLFFLFSDTILKKIK
jgi:hypothetical protein